MDSGIAIHNKLNQFRFSSEIFDDVSQGTWDGVHGWTMTLMLLLVLCSLCACALLRVSTKVSARERIKYHYRGALSTVVWGKLWGAAVGLLGSFSFRQGTDALSEHQNTKNC